jgi:hypothetical protein
VPAKADHSSENIGKFFDSRLRIAKLSRAAWTTLRQSKAQIRVFDQLPQVPRDFLHVSGTCQPAAPVVDDFAGAAHACGNHRQRSIQGFNKRDSEGLRLQVRLAKDIGSFKQSWDVGTLA